MNMYIIKAISNAVTKTGSPYVKLSLQSESESMELNIWNCKTKFKIGDSVELAQVKNSDGFYSTTSDNVKTYKTPKDSPLWKFIKLPISEELWNELKSKCMSLVEDEKQKNFIKTQFDALYPLFLKGVGGKSNHHAYAGGLLNHTYEIINMYVSMYKAIPFETNPFIVIVSALYHDSAKTLCYRKDDFSYTETFFLMNHVAASSDLLGRVMTELKFEPRLILHCQHCVLAHHELLEYGSPVKPATVEAEVLAMLDRISGHGTQIADNATVEGTQVRNLNTSCFKY